MSRRVLAVTHVFPRFDGDPSAPFLLTWAHALAEAGASVGVIAPHDAGLPTLHDVAGIRVRRVRYAPDAAEVLAYRGEMHRLIRSASGLARLTALVEGTAVAVREQVRHGGVDVVHVHWWVPSLVAVRIARPAAGVVVTVHGTDVALLESRPWLVPLARWALACADRVEAVSTDLAERLLRCTGRAADAVNPMPLRESWFDAVPARPAAPGSSPLLLAVGRLVADKGFADLVAAAALLERGVRLRIIGEGPQQRALADLATALGVALELPGRVDGRGLRAAYAEADVVVQPSYREGLGLVAAEALLAGVPVVATDSGGVRDVLPRDRLVAPGDVQQLADAITAVLDNPGNDWVDEAAADVRDRLRPAAAAARTLGGHDHVARTVRP